MKRLVLLAVLLLASAVQAQTTSFFHIPASACHGIVAGVGRVCKGGAGCGTCVAGVVGGASKPVWTCTATPGTDQAIECDGFALPPWATTFNISVTPIYSAPSAGVVGFYSYYEVTPLALVPGVWATNLGQDCAPSATTQSSTSGNDFDTQAIVPVATCNQATAATCGSVAACTGGQGYHGTLVVYRDNTSFSPNLNAAINVSEIIVGVQGP